jgi:hypothetical protein
MNFKAISLFVCCLQNSNPVSPPPSPQPPPPPLLHPLYVLTLTREVDILPKSKHQNTYLHKNTNLSLLLPKEKYPSTKCYKLPLTLIEPKME